MFNLGERIVRIHIEKLPEGVYLATSDDIQGLVAQGKTITETLEIARDVAIKLLEAQSEINLPQASESFDYQLIVGCNTGETFRVSIQGDCQTTASLWL